MRGKLPDISPSSGAFRATFPQRGKAFFTLPATFPPHLVPKPQPTTIYTLPKKSTRNLSKNSKNLLTKYDYLW